MTYTPIRERQWPPKPKTPVELGKSVWDDLNEFSRWSLGILGGRNPFATYAYMAGSMYGIGFASSYLAGFGVSTAHHTGRFALVQFLRASVGALGTTTGAAAAGVLAMYYSGRNVAYAIDPDKGEARFHYAIANPIAASTETVTNLLTAMAHQRYGGHREGGGGGF